MQARILPVIIFAGPSPTYFSMTGDEAILSRLGSEGLGLG